MHKGRRVSRNYVYNIEHNNAEWLGFHNPDGLLIEKIHAALPAAGIGSLLTYAGLGCQGSSGRP